MSSLVTPKRLLITYLVAVSLALLWIVFTYGNGCTSYSLMEVSLREETVQTFESALKTLREKEQVLDQLQLDLTRVQKSLRKQFPYKFSQILKEISLDTPVVYIITPTYARAVQKAELTRQVHTFLHVPSLHWIVIEDAKHKTDLVARLLRHSGVQYTHLYAPTPHEYKLQVSDPNWKKPRGVRQRNKGLQWLRDNLELGKDKGVVYFADDDNTYDLQLFEEMRFTRKVSVWPVGLVGKLRYESPVVENGKVTKWFSYWRSDREFALDMAGFAVSLDLILQHTDALFTYEVSMGYQESTLLSKMVTIDDLEPKADNCTKVLVWHTRAEKVNLKNEDAFKARGMPGSDPQIEV